MSDLLLALFRSSPDHYESVVEALVAERIRFIDVSNCRELASAVAVVLPDSVDVQLQAKGVPIESVPQVWVLGVPRFTDVAGLNREACGFAAAEWHSFLLSCVHLLPGRVFGVARSGPFQTCPLGTVNGAPFLSSLGWTLCPTEVVANEWGVARRRTLDEGNSDEFTILFTRKRWLVIDPVAMTFENSAIIDLLWATWGGLLDAGHIWSVLRLRLSEDVPYADGLYPALPLGTEHSRLIVRDAMY